MNRFIKVMRFVIIAMILLMIMFLMGTVIKSTGDQMRQYEITHDCRYDYNDLCYTRDEKPWLFND